MSENQFVPGSAFLYGRSGIGREVMYGVVLNEQQALIITEYNTLAKYTTMPIPQGATLIVDETDVPHQVRTFLSIVKAAVEAMKT